MATTTQATFVGLSEELEPSLSPGAEPPESGSSPRSAGLAASRHGDPAPAMRAGRHELEVSPQPDSGPAHGAGSPYLTAQQAAELLQVDEKTITRWSLSDPSMPVLRRGRVVRIHRERFFAWLERQEPRAARRTTQGSRTKAGSAV